MVWWSMAVRGLSLNTGVLHGRPIQALVHATGSPVPVRSVLRYICPGADGDGAFVQVINRTG